MDRKPAETFPIGEFIREEIKARGLTERGYQVFLFSAGLSDIQVCACEFAAYIDDPCLLLDADTAFCLAAAFGTAPDFFVNLDKTWRANLPATPVA